MQFTQKEAGLLKDMKDNERLCIERYKKHSDCAIDGQLKGLFTQLSNNETQHLNTLEGIEQGKVPAPAQDSGSTQMPTFQSVYTPAPSQDKSTDMYLCTDALAGEKHVSHLYDTGIFEFRDENIRNLLNHIQKEEQQHGKMIYDYMTTNNMYC